MKALLIYLLFFSLPAIAEVVQIDVSKLAGTQTEVGSTAVTKMMVMWAEAAKTPDGFQKYLAEKIVAKPFPGVTGPSLWGTGEIRTYILDGHHRASAYNRILRQDYDALPEEVKKVMSRQMQEALRNNPEMRFQVDVQKTFATADDLVRDFALTGRGQLPPAIRNNPEFRRTLYHLKRGDPVNMTILRQGYAQIAGDLSSLRDSPLRSAVGNAFFKSGINSDNMVNYIEFYTAERIEATLKARGVVVTAANATSPEIEREVKRAILDDKLLVRYLQNSPREGLAAQNLEMLNKAEAKFDAERLASRLQVPANCGSAFSLLTH